MASWGQSPPPEDVQDCFSCDSTRVMHVIVIAVFTFLGLIATAFRLWARKIQRIGLEINDYLCIAGLIFTIALSMFTLNSTVNWGLGSAVLNYNPNLVILQGYALLIGQLLWVAAVTFIRASVLTLYTRIFRTRMLRTTCYIIHGFNGTFGVATVLACCLVCRPLRKLWDWEDTVPGTCGDQKSLDLFIGVFNLLMDVAVVVLPLPVLWGLQLKWGKKVVLSLIFSMGIVICGVTLARIKVTTDISPTNPNATYSLIALLTCLEALLGLINASLPVLKPIFNKLSETRAFAFLSTWGSSSNRSKSQTSRRSGGGRGRGQGKGAGAIAGGVGGGAAGRKESGPWRPRAIVHKASHKFFTQDLPRSLDKRSNSHSHSYSLPSPPPSFPSPPPTAAATTSTNSHKFHYPNRGWEEDIELEKGMGKEFDERGGIRVRTDWDVEQGLDDERGSDEVELPMHPAPMAGVGVGR
ncbi:hypothetical protein MMC21_006836 [Puttea exsequens]|nr:hypothetical protein [Puttea exsequens]